MDSVKDEQEVTVEVVPQTVTEIIYLSEHDILNGEPNYYIPSEEELEDEQTEDYEIGSVDPARLQHMSLILDESQSFVLLSQPEDSFEVNVDLETKESESDNSYSDSDDDWHPPNLKQYKCDACNTKCHSRKTLNCHKLLHTNLAVLQPLKNEYICKVCGQRFERAQTLSHHFRICHESPKLICNICGCPCAHDSALLAHYKKHEPKQFGCDVCNSGYDNQVDLNNHKKTHATDLLYACNKCDAEFASTAAVSAHLRHVHAKPRTVQSYIKNSDTTLHNDCIANATPVKVQNRLLHPIGSIKRTTNDNDKKDGKVIAYSIKPKRKKR